MDSHVNQLMFMASAIIVTALLIMFGLNISTDVLNNMQDAVSQHDASEKITPIDETPIIEKLRPFFAVMKTLIPFFVIVIMGIFGLVIVLSQNNRAVTMRNKITTIRNNQKLRKRAGYLAYKHAVKLQKTINMKHYYILLNNSDILNVFTQLNEIIKVYSTNIDDFDIIMYKYEPTFAQMLQMIERAEKENLMDSPEIIDALIKAIAYPYRDIVGDGLVSIITKPMNQEIQIIKELDRN